MLRAARPRGGFVALCVRRESGIAFLQGGKSKPDSGVKRQRVVVLGTGWGAYSFIKNIDKSQYDVTVVSPRNHFLFTPLLASTTVGTLEFRSIIEPVRASGFRNEADFHLSEATGIDTEKKLVHCRSVLNDYAYSVPYEKLVVGVGARPNTFGIPGVEEHAFFLKEIKHAQVIRERILGNLEAAMHPGISEEKRRQLLHFVVVGGGPTGVEFSAELYDFLKEDVQRFYPNEAKLVRVSLVEARQILAQFDSPLRAYAEQRLSHRSRQAVIHHAVKEVRRDAILLDDGTEMPCGAVIWTAGVGPRKLTAALGWPLMRGCLVVDAQLRVKGKENDGVYALGDCAQIDKYPLPQTAQVAETQGAYLAKQLSRKDGATPSPYEFRSKGMLAYIGDFRALAQFPPLGSTEGKWHWKFPGSNMKSWNAWVVWRSAYMTKLGSWRLRLQVPMDWFKTFFFGRDISRF